MFQHRTHFGLVLLCTEIFMGDYKSMNWCKINQIMLILHSLQLVPATATVFLTTCSEKATHVRVQFHVRPPPPTTLTRCRSDFDSAADVAGNSKCRSPPNCTLA